ncbi:MAG: diadenylate cyclase CdaA [Lentisphaeria bacterium]|nr:diadenylate cyclase CdaA [Lentisphaeria bacterium]MBO5765768.1 diadenylate cyclase CdaA [Lentisphaeria bacterium]MBO5992461.1 diadenylate cyclase CdaA [Lentisphaeria bacterium]MBO7153246.1 diadenylate cyclase CdaA [Lentisphaeria bacterium]
MVWTNIIPLLAEGIQIAILFVAIYGFLYFLRNNRGLQVFVGIIVAAFVLSMILRIKGLQFDVLEHLVDVIINSLFIALIIIFQPELRRALAQLGSFAAWQGKRKRELIVEIVTAASDMARRKCGAIIVIERNTQLQNYIDDAVMLDAKVHYLLLESIFYPKSPLHDGAVIIRKDKILAARVILPLITNAEISKYLGTRHRAALGISEESDAVTVVVSEETGSLSITYKGTIHRDISSRDMENLLEKLLILKDDLELSEAVMMLDDNNDSENNSQEKRQ